MSIFVTILRAITVEPVLFAFMLGLFLQMPVSQQLFFKKNCIQLYNDSTCQNIFKNRTCGHGNKEYDTVEKETSQWILYDSLAHNPPSIVCALLLGSLSDHFGRKLIMVLPLVGICIGSISSILNIYFIDASPSYLLIGSTLSGACGGFSTMLMVVFAYMADITEGSNRTLRICLLESMTFLGGTIGGLLSGIMIDNLGYMAPYILVVALNAIAILYVLIFLHESYVPQQHSGTSLKALIHGNCKGAIQVLVKVRLYHSRLYLLLLVFIGCGVPLIVYTGSMDVIILFLINRPFCFTSTMVGYFLAISSLVSAIGVLVGVPVMNRVLKLSDPVIAGAGIVSMAVSKVFMAFTKNTWQAFLANTVSILAGVTIPSVRSMCSKLVERHELGSLFAVIASVETISTVVASLIFNNLYKSTVSTYAGLSFLVMAGVLILALCCMILFYKRPINVHLSVQDDPHLIDAEESST